MRMTRFPRIVGLALVLPLTAAAAGPPEVKHDSRPGGFSVVTRESGLEQIVNDNYALHPKWWLSGLHLVDLDGDGHLDLFLSAHGTRGAVAALGDGRGRFTLAPGKWPDTEIHLAYDFDEDGRVDLTMTHGDGGGQWWRNLSRPGTLDFQPTGMIRGAARRQAMIDIDGDGRADWLHGEGSGIHVNLADGKGGFIESNRALAGDAPTRAERLCLPVDLDGDGRIDLVTEWGHYWAPEGRSRIYRNDGKGNFTDVTAAAGLATSGLSVKGAGDLNQDGVPDLIAIENKRLEVYLNDGKGKFTKKADSLVGGGRGINAPSWGVAVVTDFDNDGVADILANGRNFLKLYRGTGDGRFLYMNDAWGIKDLSAASIDDGLCFGDINGDGKLDLVGYTSVDDRRTPAVYRNDLPAQHWINVRPVGLPDNQGAAGAKIRIHAPGTKQLLWYEQVAIFDSQAAASYYSFAQTERHFGLADRRTVDVSVEFHPSGKVVWQREAAADTTVVIREGLTP
ncbi:MAG: FG-GAP repeat domain-containing protein [Pirellulales bacterium]